MLLSVAQNVHFIISFDIVILSETCKNVNKNNFRKQNESCLIYNIMNSRKKLYYILWGNTIDEQIFAHYYSSSRKDL